MRSLLKPTRSIPRHTAVKALTSSTTCARTPPKLTPSKRNRFPDSPPKSSDTSPSLLPLRPSDSQLSPSLAAPFSSKRNFTSSHTSKPNYAHLDGMFNNLHQPSLGAAGTPLLRRALNPTSNNASQMQEIPKPREISNALFNVSGFRLDPRNQSQLATAMWQLLTSHTMAHSPAIERTDEEAKPSDFMKLKVPQNDPFFDSSSTPVSIPFARTKRLSTTTPGDEADQIPNRLSSFVDAISIYGDSSRSIHLRTKTGGMLKMQQGDLLPQNTFGIKMGNNKMKPESTPEQMMAAGDPRANENIVLLALHTIFAREHNRLASQLQEQNPHWNDEQLFQQARRTVIASQQKILFYEMLPAMFGPAITTPYTGYDPGVDPSVSVEFSTTANRLGHVQVAQDVPLIDLSEEEPQYNALSLEEATFNPDMLKTNGAIESILLGAASFKQHATEPQMVNGLRNTLFEVPGHKMGIDLAATNIMRGRDHGIPHYNALRQAYGLARKETFNDITTDPRILKGLKDVYKSVDEIDPWVGMLSEDHEEDSSTGETIRVITMEQLNRSRSGDRFWFENSDSGLGEDELSILLHEESTLARIINQNTTLQIDRNPLFVE